MEINADTEAINYAISTGLSKDDALAAIDRFSQFTNEDHDKYYDVTLADKKEFAKRYIDGGNIKGIVDAAVSSAVAENDKKWQDKHKASQIPAASRPQLNEETTQAEEVLSTQQRKIGGIIKDIAQM